MHICTSKRGNRASTSREVLEYVLRMGPIEQSGLLFHNQHKASTNSSGCWFMSFTQRKYIHLFKSRRLSRKKIQPDCQFGGIQPVNPLQSFSICFLDVLLERALHTAMHRRACTLCTTTVQEGAYFNLEIISSCELGCGLVLTHCLCLGP